MFSVQLKMPPLGVSISIRWGRTRFGEEKLVLRSASGLNAAPTFLEMATLNPPRFPGLPGSDSKGVLK